MIQYFYSLNYEVSASGVDTGADLETHHQTAETSDGSLDESGFDLVVHTRTYNLVEKYQIIGLKTLALRKFRDAASEKWNSSGFLDAVYEAYGSAPENDTSLKEAIVEIIVEHKELLDKDGTRRMLKEVDFLAYDVLMYEHL
ncbi:uncharacterized protein NECHADRAFT_89388 [Fusarium vanettenii 77-13-4]|uniref:Uncharacterized protein n=1 Tax=Fusarium vanettenii (strain ATCC MYA-4622 / CBS 123669 / FGSC 9596 / NRRL 45880 / 77-13-4) TaxID=660122 RepID=C7ZR19_FUSV7|nr:uncharacterized protein NECHADRAFT_89388 [Fusarium vanettenii 77-13-4]EEU33542.1 hypothetical protein NECHADRAFT_89388 [Fusarium vanettenii 77-13-4]